MMSSKNKDLSPDLINKGKKAAKALPINIQLFSHKKQSSGRARRMPKAVSEAMTNATPEQRRMPSYTINIKKYK